MKNKIDFCKNGLVAELNFFKENISIARIYIIPAMPIITRSFTTSHHKNIVFLCYLENVKIKKSSPYIIYRY